MRGAVPTLHRGKLYPSQSALARELGISQQAVYLTLEKHGHTGRLGTFSPRRTYRVGPVTFTGRKAAAEALGMSVDQFRHAISARASAAVREDLVARAMRYHRRGGKA